MIRFLTSILTLLACKDKVCHCVLPSDLQWTQSAQDLPSVDLGCWGCAATIFNDTMFLIGGNFSYVKWISLDDLHDSNANPSAWNTVAWVDDPFMIRYGEYMHSFSGFTMIDNYMYLTGPWDWGGFMLIYDIATRQTVSAADYQNEMPYNTTEPCMSFDCLIWCFS